MSEARNDLFLDMQCICKRYRGVQALEAVDFAIARGEIHCLVGENGSGKSTLIKIISGVESPDEGSRIVIDGQEFHHLHSIDAIRRGIEVIYQDLSLFPNLTVEENIALPQAIASGSRVMRWPLLRRIAREALGRIQVELPLEGIVGELSVADQQLVAICRALTSGVRLLILDEPTTALTRREVESLFRVIQDLQARGIATLFVSHKLDEVLKIAQRVTILRDGRKIGTYPAAALDGERLTFLMTGRKLASTKYCPQEAEAPSVLEVRGLSKMGQFSNVSFCLAPSEILGITGLLGSGRSELAQALFGMNRPDSGEVRIDGCVVRLNSVQAAIRHGIGYVPENRLVQGLVMPQSVGRNVVITIIDKLVRALRLVDERRKKDSVDHWMRELAIKAPSLEAPVQTLSGGNQQRVVLAKWLATQPRILILDGPTMGVDVAAKSSIHEIVRRLAAGGMGIIVISDEVSEVVRNCNRILVMHHGRILREFQAAEVCEEELQSFINEAGRQGCGE
jgi:simple sugar transport system ATP-binding protein